MPRRPKKQKASGGGLIALLVLMAGFFGVFAAVAMAGASRDVPVELVADADTAPVTPSQTKVESVTQAVPEPVPPVVESIPRPVPVPEAAPAPRPAPVATSEQRSNNQAASQAGRPRETRATQPVQPRPGNREPVSPQRKKSGRLVVVIDDVGHNLGQLGRFLTIPVPVTYAVLPGLEYSVQASRQIRQAGKELILHQPMEALGQQDEGPGVILAAMSTVQISDQVGLNLDEIGYAVGANNHMGSKGTSEVEVLEPLMASLQRRGLFFLDSRTIAGTRARQAAQRQGVAFLERDVFLDNSKDPAAIRQALRDGVTIADKKGYAIMIGHVWTAELATVLLEEYRPLLDQGYSFDTLASLILQPPVPGDRP